MTWRSFVAIGALLAGSIQVPRDAPRPAAIASATIAGVVHDEQSAPVAGAQVVVSSQAQPVVNTAMTGADGRYAIDRLPAGTYVVRAMKPGFTSTAFGSTRFISAGVTVVLAAGERFHAPIVMPRVSAVSGTIVDEHGDPAVASVAFLIRRAAPSRGSPLQQIRKTESDRNGRYRIEGLPAGSYLVRATRVDAPADVGRISPEAIAAARAGGQPPPPPPGAFTYLPVYYPGVASSTAARPIAVEPGTERHAVDLQLQVVETVAFNGVLVDPAGAPLANATTRLLGDDEALERYGSTTANGRFQFVGVPPGSYLLAARALLPLMPDGKRTVLWGAQELFVGPGTPIDPVLTLHPGGDLRGRIVFDGAAAIPEFRRASPIVQLVALSGAFSRFTPLEPAIDLQEAGGPTRSFDVRIESVPPGRYAIVCPPALPGGWSFRSALLGGADVSAIPFEVTAGSRLDGLIATYTDRRTSLSGTVKNEIGEPVFAHTLVVFPADRRAWHAAMANRLRIVQPDSAGKYAIADLPPGEYLVGLVRDLDPAAFLLAETLESLAAGAVRVRLSEGSPTVQDLQTRTGS
jgi:hypothetical protein